MYDWISRLAERLADLYELPAFDSLGSEGDADARRVRSELDAIRMHHGDFDVVVCGERSEARRSRLTTMGEWPPTAPTKR
ncbi:MAG: hypothetical protein AB7G47_12320 [Mycolicibacterium sp.]|uniref:hypothetical protein n=1 Tax=Mycolicibacterium sp. TaxID=2320850 RepID=UPI003D10B470